MTTRTAEKITQDLEARYKDKPDSLVFSRLADAVRKEGNADRAIEICSRGLQDNPSYVTGRIILGRCFLEQGKLEQAAKEFETVCSYDRFNQVAIKMLADIYVQQGGEQKAGDLYRLLLKSDPFNKSLVELSNKYRASGKTTLFDILGIAQPQSQEHAPEVASETEEPSLLKNLDDGITLQDTDDAFSYEQNADDGATIQNTDDQISFSHGTDESVDLQIDNDEVEAFQQNNETTASFQMAEDGNFSGEAQSDQFVEELSAGDGLTIIEEEQNTPSDALEENSNDEKAIEVSGNDISQRMAIMFGQEMPSDISTQSLTENDGIAQNDESDLIEGFIEEPKSMEFESQISGQDISTRIEELFSGSSSETDSPENTELGHLSEAHKSFAEELEAFQSDELGTSFIDGIDRSQAENLDLPQPNLSSENVENIFDEDILTSEFEETMQFDNPFIADGKNESDSPEQIDPDNSKGLVQDSFADQPEISLSQNYTATEYENTPDLLVEADDLDVEQSEKDNLQEILSEPDLIIDSFDNDTETASVDNAQEESLVADAGLHQIEDSFTEELVQNVSEIKEDKQEILSEPDLIIDSFENDTETASVDNAQEESLVADVGLLQIEDSFTEELVQNVSEIEEDNQEGFPESDLATKSEIVTIESAIVDNVDGESFGIDGGLLEAEDSEEVAQSDHQEIFLEPDLTIDDAEIFTEAVFVDSVEPQEESLGTGGGILEAEDSETGESLQIDHQIEPELTIDDAEIFTEAGLGETRSAIFLEENDTSSFEIGDSEVVGFDSLSEGEQKAELGSDFSEMFVETDTVDVGSDEDLDIEQDDNAISEMDVFVSDQSSETISGDDVVAKLDSIFSESPLDEILPESDIELVANKLDADDSTQDISEESPVWNSLEAGERKSDKQKSEDVDGNGQKGDGSLLVSWQDIKQRIDEVLLEDDPISESVSGDFIPDEDDESGDTPNEFYNLSGENALSAGDTELPEGVENVELDSQLQNPEQAETPSKVSKNENFRDDLDGVLEGKNDFVEQVPENTGLKVSTIIPPAPSVKESSKGEGTDSLYSIPDHVLTPTLADIYYQQGQFQLASQIYTRLLSRDPENTKIIKKLDQINDLIAQGVSEGVALHKMPQPLERNAGKSINRHSVGRKKKVSKVEEDDRPLAGVRIKKRKKKSNRNRSKND